MKKIWIVKIAALFIVGFLVKSALLMWLWNWLVPDLFHGPLIRIVQAMGLIALSKMLFIGFGGFRGGHSWKGRWNHWKDKMEKMSPEERERMRSLWKQRCCGFDSVKDESESYQAGSQKAEPEV